MTTPLGALLRGFHLSDIVVGITLPNHNLLDQPLLIKEIREGFTQTYLT